MLAGDKMDNVGCHVVYVHRNVRQHRLIRAGVDHDCIPNDGESADVNLLLLPLLEAFNHGTLRWVF